MNVSHKLDQLRIVTMFEWINFYESFCPFERKTGKPTEERLRPNSVTRMSTLRVLFQLSIDNYFRVESQKYVQSCNKPNIVSKIKWDFNLKSLVFQMKGKTYYLYLQQMVQNTSVDSTRSSINIWGWRLWIELSGNENKINRKYIFPFLPKSLLLISSCSLFLDLVTTRYRKQFGHEHRNPS